MPGPIRYVQSSELPLLFSMAENFWAEGKLPGQFKPEVFIRTWTTLMENNIGRILGYFKEDRIAGALGFILSPDPNDGEMVATEMFWFVLPSDRGGTGLKLLHFYERLAKAAGAKRTIMAHLQGLNDEKLKHLFARRGYRPIETHYLKENA